MKRRPSAQSRVTLASVAEDAGVSITTVSLILANRNGWVEQFHPETVQRVRASAERLGYRRNLFASGLPVKDPRFFALVLRAADSNPGEWNSWAFQGELVEGVNAAAEGQDIYIVLTSARAGANTDTGKVSGIIDGGVFGAIFESPRAETESLIRAQLGRNLPVVAVFPETTSSWPTNAIDMDNLAAGRVAGGLLASGTRRQWVLVRCEPMSEACRLRCEGLMQVARESGACLSTFHLPLNVDEKIAAELLANHLRRRNADAIYAVDSVSSITALLGTLRAGLTPGSNCSIVGCEASQWKIPGLPTLTSVDVSWRQAGVTAVEQLLKARANKGRFHTILMKPRIVAGDSCPLPQSLKPERRRTSPARLGLSGIAV